MISKENKAKYFSQYFGQKIMRWHQWLPTTENSIVQMTTPMSCGILGIDDGWFLELKSLSSMSNTDIILLVKKALFDVWGHYSELKNVQYYEENDDVGIVAFTEDNERIGFTINHHNGIQFRLSINSVSDIYLNYKAMYDAIIQLGYAIDYSTVDNNEITTYSVDKLIEMKVINLIN